MNACGGINDILDFVGAQPDEPSRGIDRRGPRRFSLSLEMKIVDINGQPVARIARTRNMSSGGGVSFLCGEALSVGSLIRYFITLSPPPQLVRLSGTGRIVRCVERHPYAKGETFELAVTMESSQVSRD